MIETVKGFKDFTGKDAEKRAFIQEVIRRSFERYNYEQTETPVIEYEEFVKSENSQDEVISDIFKLKDKGDRKLALRYEFTFQLKRIAKNKKLPYKRFQIGPVFRDEPVQGNRLRQFTQCDVDVVGSTIKDEAEIFNNTIKYNITMDLNVKKKEIDKAIEMAHLQKVIDRLDKGIQTNVLEKGVSLSGGEKQRLALARGLLAANKSNIILLDEPTSSVDNINEMKIHELVFKEFKNKTIISSIHRLHLLNKFDYIYLFDKGKIIAEGTLSEIKTNPTFKHIWRKYGIKKK